MDSNHRRRKPADLQSAPVGHLGNLPKKCDRTAPEVEKKAPIASQRRQMAAITTDSARAAAVPPQEWRLCTIQCQGQAHSWRPSVPEVVGQASCCSVEIMPPTGIGLGGASVLLPIIGREPDGQPEIENYHADYTNLRLARFIAISLLIFSTKHHLACRGF